MTKPEIKKLVREYFNTRLLVSSDQKEDLEFFKAGYLKGVEMERKRCLYLIENFINDKGDLLNRNGILHSLFEIRNKIEQDE